MHKQFYTQKKKFTKYDREHYLLYLNEQEAQAVINEESPIPVSGYEYTGNNEDGGTLIKATEATYEQFVSGLIRTRYSADQVEAIILNFQSSDHERMEEFSQELEDLNAYRQQCKEVIQQLLQIE